MSFTTSPFTTNPWTTEPYTSNSWGTDDAFYFTNDGATLTPLITVTGTPDILWTWSDGTTDTNANPTDVTSVGENSLLVSDWDAVVYLYFYLQSITSAIKTKEWKNAVRILFHANAITGSLQTWDWPNAKRIQFYDNNFYSTLQTKAWENAELLYFHSNNFFGELKIWPWANATELYFSSNDFTSISGSFQPQIKMTVCRLDGNDVTSSSQIDSMLSDLVINAADAGRVAVCNVNASGGTMSGPTAAGTANKDILVDTYGWTVTLNAEVGSEAVKDSLGGILTDSLGEAVTE